MPRRKPPVDPDDSALFRSAVGDITPLADDRAPPPGRPPGRQVTSRRVAREDTGSTAHAGDPGHARRSVPERTLANLRRGKLPPEELFDLHGLRRHEAELAVQHFLDRACGRGRRCVLLIHGVGRSRDGGGILRGALPGWLERHPAVLAHVPALPKDGGLGASYVLLRRLKK